VKYLSLAVKSQPDNVKLKTQLESWEKELPAKQKPDGWKTDWSKMPKEALANWCGKVPRRVGFNDQEITDMWKSLKLEPKKITSKNDPDFAGYDEKGRIKQLPPRHIGRRTFYRVIMNMSGKIEEDEFEALWDEADQDGDGLLSFDEFAHVMRFDEADAKKGKPTFKREEESKEESENSDDDTVDEEAEAEQRRRRLEASKVLSDAMQQESLENLKRAVLRAKASGVVLTLIDAAEVQLRRLESTRRLTSATEGVDEDELQQALAAARDSGVFAEQIDAAESRLQELLAAVAKTMSAAVVQ